MDLQFVYNPRQLRRMWPLLLNVFVTGMVIILIDLIFNKGIYPVDNGVYEAMFKVGVFGALTSCSLISIHYLTSGMKYRRAVKVGAVVSALAFNAIVAILAPVTSNDNFPQMFLMRYMIFCLTYVAFLVVLPIWNLKKTGEAWHYLFKVLIVGLFSGLITGILQIGMTLALVAIGTLFRITIGEHAWLILTVVVMYMVSQSLFWLLMPANIDTKLTSENYPVALLRFVQFVLLPLATVYMLILYTYTALSIVSANLPNNQLVWMVTGFLTPAVIAMTLLWPLASTRRWVRFVTVIYSLLSLPLVLLLFYAIGVRISGFGFTVDRVIVVILGIWFGLVFAYVLIGKWVKPQLLLMSLPLMLLAAACFPVVNMYSLSQNSQTDKLVALLVNSGYTKNGVLVKQEGKVDYQLYTQISDLVSYLNVNFGLDNLRPLFAEAEAHGITVSRLDSYQGSYKLLDYYFTSGDYYDVSSQSSTTYTLSLYSSTQDRVVDVKGYDELINFYYYPPFDAEKGKSQPISGLEGFTETKLDFDQESLQVTVTFANGDAIGFDVAKLVQSKIAGHPGVSYLSVEEMSLTSSDKSSKAKLIIESMSLDVLDGIPKSAISVSGKLLTGVK